MSYTKIFVPGGAGFVGSHLALGLKATYPGAQVIALDSLRRRGSELNLPRLRQHGVSFAHGDVRSPSDIAEAGAGCDLVVDCSAEPSVLAGLQESSTFVVQTNLTGTANCLELARHYGADFLFLSTSRVYPIVALNNLAYDEMPTRYVLRPEQRVIGASDRGIDESFTLAGYRSLYGAAKLASELLIEEYHQSFGLRTIVNRCGVIGGPWQMGKVDQGIFAHWMLSHVFGQPLSYLGYGGSGKQVRDLLHVDDLVDLIVTELSSIGRLAGKVFNVGGGLERSLSLLEATELSRRISGAKVPIEPVHDERPLDLRIYVTDSSLVQKYTGWQPHRSPEETLTDLYRWVVDHRVVLEEHVRAT